jgi:branched-chain amino acid transport system permease protein
MTGMLGVNVPLGLLLSVVASFFLAGMAGGLLLPNQSLSPELGDAFFQYAFFAVIIGGLGNIRGAFIASILLGLVDSLNTVFLPHIPRLAMYVALAAFLLWRPTGLFPNVAMGTEGAAQHIVADKPGKWVSRRAWQFIGLVVFACVAAVPFWANEGLLFLIGTALIQGVFALSWNILFGYAGLASFGHAAFFALGAYFMGAILRYYPEIPFLGTLVLSGMMGAVVAWLVGSLALRRLSGVFLAILTVALCEVTRLLISYSALLGKDDGLVNIPRPKFNLIVPVNLSSSAAYFWFLLIAVSLLIGFLWWVVHGRYGRILLSIRQDPARAAFLGISVARVRISAFMLSGGVAAIAGALYAPWARIVTLDEANLLASTQPLLNAMLGGVNSFWGPLLGSAVFTMINFATRTMIGLSEVIVGSILLFIILVAPNGLVGLWRRIEEWLQGGRQTADANAAILPETRSSVEIQSGAH